VSVEAVLAIIRQNVTLAKAIVKGSAEAIAAQWGQGDERRCGCPRAAEHAIMTARDQIPPATRAKLELLFGPYMKTSEGK
jgi:5'-methylthioadenosine phosphorylase